MIKSWTVNFSICRKNLAILVAFEVLAFLLGFALAKRIQTTSVQKGMNESYALGILSSSAFRNAWPTPPNEEAVSDFLAGAKEGLTYHYDEATFESIRALGALYQKKLGHGVLPESSKMYLGLEQLKSNFKAAGPYYELTAGVLYRPVCLGSGRTIQNTDTVLAHYTLTDPDNHFLENTKLQLQPQRIAVKALPPALRELFCNLKEGSRVLAWVPTQLVLSHHENYTLVKETFWELEIVKIELPSHLETSV